MKITRMGEAPFQTERRNTIRSAMSTQGQRWIDSDVEQIMNVIDKKAIDLYPDCEYPYAATLGDLKGLVNGLINDLRIFGVLDEQEGLMHALLDYIPEHCPRCVAQIRVDVHDWMVSEPHTCPYCGVHFRYVRPELLEQMYERMEDGVH